MVKELVRIGYDFLQQGEIAKEKEKEGYFRGGSGGAFLNGKFYGTCPRKALLRFYGIQDLTTLDTYFCFATGIQHEQTIINLLLMNPKVTKLEVWGKPEFYFASDPRLVVHENSLETKIDEIPFTGRPDMVITYKDGYQFGIETKATISANKATTTCAYPLTYAVLQAAMYKSLLNIDWEILYGNYAFHSSYEFRAVPETEKYPFILYTHKLMKNGRPGTSVKVPVGLREYKVVFNQNGAISIVNEAGRVMDTPFTKQSLYDYYTALKECISMGQLPDRPTEWELEYEEHGKPSWMTEEFSACMFCPYKDICDKYDKEHIDYKGYLEEAKTTKVESISFE